MKKTIFKIKEKVDFEIKNNIIKPENNDRGVSGRSFTEQEEQNKIE
jgi:hypothetical protein